MYNFTIRYNSESGTNILNPDQVTQGYIWNVDVAEYNVDRAYSGFCVVIPNTQYQSGGSSGSNIISHVSFYNSEKDNIGFLDTGLSDNFTTPADCVFAVVTFKSINDGEPDVTLISITPGLNSDSELYYVSTVVNPIFDKLDRTQDKQSGFEFYRTKIKGVLKLLNSDYSLLFDQPFDTEFLIDIEDSTKVFENYTGVFYKTDCKWDDDSKIVVIKHETRDEYEYILAGLNKTFNLIDLKPELESIDVKRRPLIQIYIPGSTVVTNVMGATFWEQEIQTEPITDTNDLINVYKFFNSQNIRSIASGYSSVLSTDVTGAYDDNRENGDYRLIEESRRPFLARTRYRFTILKISTGEPLYRTQWTKKTKPIITTVLFGGINGNTGSFYFTEYRIYTRYYTDVEVVDEQPTHTIPSTDIVANNSNYETVIGYDLSGAFQFYDEFSKAPTKFGKVPDDAPNKGEYYKELTVLPSSGLSNPIPISSSHWVATSLWFFNSKTIRQNEFNNGADFQLRNSYPLHSVIDVLLRASGSRIVFNNNSSHSEVLYSGSNPITSFTYLDFDGSLGVEKTVQNFHISITPKSNILIGDYDQPAQKLNVSLSQILRMLKDTMRLEWHIRDNRLILEHISWYQNGGTYSTPKVGLDLTTDTNIKNNLSWGFAQNKWEFDKQDMPQRLEYNWMDDVSTAFEGFPIEVSSKFVQQGKIDDYTIGNTTTDIDFLMANPNEASKAGLVMLGCVDDQNVSYEYSDESAYLGTNNLYAQGVGYIFSSTGLTQIVKIESKLWVRNNKDVIFKISTGDLDTLDQQTVVEQKTFTALEFNKIANGFFTYEMITPFALSPNEFLHISLETVDGSTDVGMRTTFEITTADVYHIKESDVWSVSVINASDDGDHINLGDDRFIDQDEYYEDAEGNLYTEPDPVDPITPIELSEVNVYAVPIRLYGYKIRRVPFLKRNLAVNSEVIIQNGFMSWLFLHPIFHTSDLPSNNVKINNEDVVLTNNITRFKKQEVSYPLNGVVDPYKLVKTALGNGIIEKMSIDMLSYQVKAIIRHDTE